MRLETVDKELLDRLKKSTIEQQKKSAIAACELALKMSEVDIPDAIACLESIQSGNLLSSEKINKLEIIIARLDEQYFDSKHNTDRPLNAKSLQFFSQARAISALIFLGREQSLTAASEAIYEASSSVDDGTIIFEKVRSVLSAS
ncbi:hypothetical protein [Pseudomonas syringae]|nr:hypothetical protein [Pseudomonas syringae]MCF5469833.1 hypothetical protein [Pseudomonas syringae]MCF5475344.1 hypothetical protein [Pseudomonas syringae]MCF5485811.1 hypothetical protein [Pseudomonas syringae]MCF5500444.1 hypothetical protein [Pseudomonas syringae]MCF5523078.1 hypothetical protein [Pseudomonas syringae]